MPPRDVVDVVIGSLYQKAVNVIDSATHDVGYRRGRIAMTERQMKVDLIGKLSTIFELAELNDPTLESLISYHFLFVLRLYLVNTEVHIRCAVLRLLRHISLSNRILQICCDLLIPELVAPCLERLTVSSSKSWVAENLVDQWNLEERVHALKLIRHWCCNFIAHQTHIPIPICFLRSLVSVGRPRPPSSNSPKTLDPLQLFCCGTLRDLIVGSDVPTFQRLSEVGGISAIVETMGDVAVFETDPGFCKSLIVAMSAVFGGDVRRLSLGDPEIITLKKTIDRLLPMCIFDPDGEPVTPWRPASSRPFVELSYLCSKMMEPLIVSPEMGVGDGAKNMFHQKFEDSVSRKKIQEQEREQVKCLRAIEQMPFYHGAKDDLLRWRKWRASSFALLTVCRTFSGLLAVAAHPSGLRGLVDLLRQPIDVVSRLRLIQFFARLMRMGITCTGIPLEAREDLLALIFCRAVRGYWQNCNDVPIDRQEFREQRQESSTRQVVMLGSLGSTLERAVEGVSVSGSKFCRYSDSAIRRRKSSISSNSRQRKPPELLDASIDPFISKTPSSEFEMAMRLESEVSADRDVTPNQFGQPFLPAEQNSPFFCDGNPFARQRSSSMLTIGNPPLEQVEMQSNMIRRTRKLEEVAIRTPPAFSETFPVDSNFLIRTGLTEGDRLSRSVSPSDRCSMSSKVLRTTSTGDHTVMSGSFDDSTTPVLRQSFNATGTASLLNRSTPYCGTAQRELELRSSPSVSSLWVLSCTQPLGSMPSELVTASGLGYSSIDLRDIYGTLLLRMLLHSGLHIALASIVVDVRSFFTTSEDLRKGKSTRSETHQEDLLFSAEKLLSVIVCAASFLLPPQSADETLADIEARCGDVVREPQSPMTSCRISQMSLNDNHDERQHSSYTRSRFSSSMSVDVSEKSVVSTLADDPAIRGLQHLLRRMSTCPSPTSPAGTPKSATVYRSASPPISSSALANIRRNSVCLENCSTPSPAVSTSFQRHAIPQRTTSVDPFNDNKGRRMSNPGLRFSSYIQAALESEPFHSDSQLFIQARARRLIYQFSRFMSGSFFTARKQGLANYRATLKRQLGSYVSRTPAFESLNGPSALGPFPSASVMRQRSSFVSLKSGGSRAGSPQATLTSPVGGEEAGLVETHCICCGVEQMQNILNYAKYASGVIVHSELLYSLRVHQVTQKSLPFNAAPGLDASSHLTCYLKATGVLLQSPCVVVRTSEDSNDLASITTTTSTLNASHRRTESETASSSSETTPQASQDFNLQINTPQLPPHLRQHPAFTIWNWKLIYRLLTGPLKSHMALFSKCPSTNSFISALVQFYLPSSRLFASVPWCPNTLYMSVCGVHLFLLLIFLEENFSCPTFLGVRDAASPGRTAAVSADLPDLMEQGVPNHDNNIILRTTFLNDIVACLNIELAIALERKLETEKEERSNARSLCMEEFSNSSKCWISHGPVHSDIFAAEDLIHSQRRSDELARRSSTCIDGFARRSSTSFSSERSQQWFQDLSIPRPRCLSEQCSPVPNPPYFMTNRPSISSLSPYLCNLSQNPLQSHLPFKLADHPSSRPRGFSDTKVRSLRYGLVAEDDFLQPSSYELNGAQNQQPYGIGQKTRANSCGDFSRKKPNRRRILFNPNTHTSYPANPVILPPGGNRIFTREATQFSLTREYSTLVGSLCSTSGGINALVKSGFFDVLYSLVTFPSRDYLTLPFIKQLNMNFLPCRAIVEQVTLRGSPWLTLAVVRHFGLIIEGGGVPTSLSDIPSIEVMYKQAATDRQNEPRRTATFELGSQLSRNEGYQTEEYLRSLSPGNAAHRLDGLECQQKLWEWLLNVLMNLVLRVEFTSHVPEEQEHSDLSSNFTPRASSEVEGENDTRNACNCEVDPCRSGICGIGQKCCALVSEAALLLVTEMCKLGGDPIVISLLKHLPDHQKGITIPAINAYAETSRFHDLFGEKSPIHFPVCQLSPHFSLLKDWPASLKIQLLQIDVGAKYLIHTGWAQNQFARYDNYAHNQSYLTSGSLRRRSSEWEIKSQGVFGTSSDGSQRSPERRAGTLEFLVESPDGGSQPRQRGKAFRLPSLSPTAQTAPHVDPRPDISCTHLYVTLIDALLKNAFWNYTPAQQTLAILDTSGKSKSINSDCLNLIIPDPYLYHFYVARDFYPDRFSPYIPSNDQYNDEIMGRSTWGTSSAWGSGYHSSASRTEADGE